MVERGDGVAAAGDRNQLRRPWSAPAACLAATTVPRSNGVISNAPSGPFQTSVLASSIAATNARDRLRADVEDHVVGAESRRSHRRASGALALNSLATTTSSGRMIAQFAASALSMIAQRGFGEIVLAQRLADADALRGEEGVGHAAADDQRIDLRRRDFRAGRAWSTPWRRRRSPITGWSALAERLAERLQFRLHGAAGIGGQLVRRGLRSWHARGARPRRRR